MKRREEIFVPYLGQSLNVLTRGEGGWRYYSEKKKVEAAALAAGLHLLERFEQPVVISLFPRLGKRRRNFDCTNYAGSLKLIEDQLVRCGVLVDDSPEYVRGVFMGAPERADELGEGMVVIVQAVEGEIPPQQVAMDLAERAF